MKILKILLSLLAALVIIAVLVGGYLGLVPGVSHLFGSDRPRDLGITASQAAHDSGLAQIKVERVTGAKSADGGPVYSGSHKVDASLSNEEISSLMQNGSFNDIGQYNPVGAKFQIKISAGGVIETSGTVNLAKLKAYAKVAQWGDVDQLADKLGPIGQDVPFYTSGTASAANNSATLNFTKIEIGRWSVPMTPDINAEAGVLVTQRMNQVPGFSAESVTFTDGKMHFVGTLPDKIQTE